ncbi:MAG TPA: glycosyltransferase family 2 protein [Solirubrobacteraceae bacterium]
MTITERSATACQSHDLQDALLMSVVVPIYLNGETLCDLVHRLEDLSELLSGRIEAIFVIDGSPDDSGAVLRTLLRRSVLRSRLLWHSRNFGAFAAVRTGLSVAVGQCIVVMSADLQEPAGLAIAFYQALATGEYEVAVGVRRERHDPLASRIGSSWFWAIYCRLVQPEMPIGGVDVFACTLEVRDALLSLCESNTSLVGLLIWLGYRRAEIPYARAPRAAGRSSWTLRKKVRYLLDSIYSFTDLPINMLLAIGVTGVLLSSTGGLAVFFVWAIAGIRIAGYTPIMLTLLMLGSLTLSGLGVVGSYVWRTYENSKRRPHAVATLSESFHDV